MFTVPTIVQVVNIKKTRGVSHYGIAIYIKKVSKGKRRIMEIQIFHHAKI
jgi:hypothetical protein